MKIYNYKYLIFLIFISLVTVTLIGCSQLIGMYHKADPKENYLTDKTELWNNVLDHIRKNNNNPTEIMFPEQSDNFITKKSKDKYIVEAYFTELLKTSCCETLSWHTFFKCIVIYKNGEYIIKSLEFKN